MSLRRTVTGEAFPYNLREGTKGVQLAQTAIENYENAPGSH